jgi:hypothetical protein
MQSITMDTVLNQLANDGHFDLATFLTAEIERMNARNKNASPSQPPQSPTEPAAAEVEGVGRLIESPAYVVFRSSAVDWQLVENPDISLEELPLNQRQKFDVIVEASPSQFRLLVKPEGTHLDNFEGKPVLDILLEINGGVPCVHLTNDPADVMLLSVFANAQGLVVRPEDGEWLCANDYSVPKALKRSVLTHCDESALNNCYVAILDTQKKYANRGSVAES